MDLTIFQSRGLWTWPVVESKDLKKYLSLILSNSFLILAIKLFQIALKTCKMQPKWPLNDYVFFLEIHIKSLTAKNKNI